MKELTEEIPDIKEDVTTMDRNINRLIALVSQILDFRQTEMKGFSLDFGPVNVNAVLQEMFLDFTLLAKKKNLQYNPALPSDAIKTFADEEALKKIFSNLLSNATKYAATEVQVKIFIDDRNTNEYIIEIENDGYIIPAEMREKIFEPFFTTKPTGQGSGLGLSISYDIIVKGHQGELKVESKEGEFTEFIISLPVN